MFLYEEKQRTRILQAFLKKMLKTKISGRHKAAYNLSQTKYIKAIPHPALKGIFKYRGHTSVSAMQERLVAEVW